jgi:hypothetical protein
MDEKGSEKVGQDTRELIRHLDEAARRALEIAESALHDRDAEIAALLASLQEVAEDSHMKHGAHAEGFWCCSRPICKHAAKLLREIDHGKSLLDWIERAVQALEECRNRIHSDVCCLKGCCNDCRRAAEVLRDKP